MRHHHTTHRRSVRPVRALGAAAGAAVLLTTAACGGSGGSGDSGASDASSSSASSAGSAANPLTKSDIGQRLAAGFESAKTFRFTLDGTTSGQRLAGKGQADISQSPVASQASVEVAGQQIQLVSADGVFYVKSPVFGTDGKWLQIDPKASKGLGAFVGQLEASGNPSTTLKQFDKASSVTAKGTKEIGGVDTTTYLVEIPSSALAASIGGAGESLLKELPDTIAYTINVDGDDQVRRLASSFTVRGVTSKTAVTFDDFGDEVSITAPPASQVTTKSPALDSLGG